MPASRDDTAELPRTVLESFLSVQRRVICEAKQIGEAAMEMQLRGVIDGRHIELDQETEIPDGSAVLVSIQPAPLDLSGKLRLADTLCGAWADDASLAPIFAEIERARHLTAPRDIDFDAAS